MDWEDQSKAPEGYVDGPAKISVVENGPVRVGIQVERWARGSHFVEVVRLAAGQAGSRVEFVNHIDWQTKEAALMAVMPLTVSNPLATYNWELGTIKRSTDDPLKYEVPSHQWFDLTDNSGKYGVTVLSGDRYGSDKPTDSTLRLTLVYTPGVRAGFVHQATNDWGHHDLSFAITGHSGDWTPQSSQWPALRFDRPLIAFQAPSHRGALGKSFSFARTNNPSVSVEALKQAEASHQIVVRFNELAGKPEKNVEASFASAVISAKEVNGQETAIGPATVINGNLVFDMTAYRPRAFALTLAAPHVHLSAPSGTPVKLAYNVNVTKPFGSPLGGSFDSSGNAIPADMLPSSLVSDGIAFALAPADAAKNAVEARGQKITLQNHSADEKLYILAASSSGDKSTTFAVGGREEIRTIQAWNGKIGQWDDRVWGGIIPELTYDMTNPLIGLNPGYIKRDPVAWYSDHIRGGDGVNQAYNYCYVYRYALELPAGAASVTLPNQPDIKILAATISDDPNAEVVPAQNLYDTLQRPSSNQPQVATNPSADGGSTTVEIESPLYFQPNASIRYTVDGSKPTLQSAAYAAPLVLSQSAVVKAAYIKNDGTVLGIASASAAVANPSGPKVTGVSANSATTLTLSFSELLDRATASDPAHYTLSPTNAISSAALSASGTSVTLTLAAPRDDSQDGTITVSGVTSAVPGGLPVSNGNAVSIPRPHVIFERDQAVTYDGTNAFSQDVTGLPTSGSAPWTINLWAYFENTPGELTTLAGFGDDSDTTGAERYLLKYHDGIHFWGSNIDISTGILYDLSKWQMVTATFDGTSLRIYKDGALIKTAPITLTDAASTVKIGPNGPWDNASKINGKIARVRIWSAALSDAEINALFSSPPAN
jgi:alpha-mannosidase